MANFSVDGTGSREAVSGMFSTVADLRAVWADAAEWRRARWHPRARQESVELMMAISW